MPIDYRDYPANWKTHIVPAIAERSLDHCERCAVENRRLIVRYSDGRPWRYYDEIDDADLAFDIEAGLARLVKIVLTVAHMDHDLANNDGMDRGGRALPSSEANLLHLCQKCHNQHDAANRARNRQRSKDRLSGQIVWGWQ